MSRKDSVCKEFFRIPERFADTCNGILFGGEELIKPDELSEIDIEYAYVNRIDKKAIVDIARKWNRHDLTIALLVQENQSNTDYAMVFRNMLSEALMYNRQLIDREKEHREEGDLKPGGEFISGITEDDKFTPVITIVLYLGREKWDGKIALHDMLTIDDSLKPYVTNHRINLYDYNDYESYEIFKTDVSLVFEALAANKDRSKIRKLFDGERGIVSADTMRFVGTMLDMKNVDEYITINENGEEEGRMCKALEDLVEEGREEGRAEMMAELAKRDEKIAERDEKIAEKDEKIAEKDAEIARLKAELAARG